MANLELARRHYVYTINTTTTVIVTYDTKGIKVKFLGNVKGEFQLKKKKKLYECRPGFTNEPWPRGAQCQGTANYHSDVFFLNKNWTSDQTKGAMCILLLLLLQLLLLCKLRGLG